MSKSLGFIPLRKGSKGILNKNTKRFVGRPLFSWVLDAAILSQLDEIIVYTDDDHLIEFIAKEYHWTSKVKALLRSDLSATDTASTEMAILEFDESYNYDFDLLCLLQATSPFTTSNDINAALNKLVNEDFDSVLSVVKTHRFVWDESGTPFNYDVFNRPRRQDFNGLLIENGAVYVTKSEALKVSKNRISGSIGLLEMHEDTYHEIDSASDWVLLENLCLQRLKQSKSSDKITHLILDVDGVFTPGNVWFDKTGELAKSFDMRDGMGLELLRNHGINVIVLTSEQSALVAARMQKLNITHTYLGVRDKYSFLKYLSNSIGFKFSNIAYIGDDVNDLAGMCSAGWSFAPSNAMPIIREHADIKLQNKSGSGAIREAVDFILNYNNRF